MFVAAAFFTGFDAKNGLKIYRRDRRNHASPNSAHPESVCAGALHVQLAGDAYYFGKLYKKKTIGIPRGAPPTAINSIGAITPSEVFSATVSTTALVICPHIHLWSNPAFGENFVRKCEAYRWKQSSSF